MHVNAFRRHSWDYPTWLPTSINTLADKIVVPNALIGAISARVSSTMNFARWKHWDCSNEPESHRRIADLTLSGLVSIAARLRLSARRGRPLTETGPSGDLAGFRKRIRPTEAHAPKVSAVLAQGAGHGRKTVQRRARHHVARELRHVPFVLIGQFKIKRNAPCAAFYCG
jgi:hypothetical protein